MPKDFDFSRVSKKIFVDAVHARIINGLQHIAFQSGEELTTFVLPLPISKTIARGLLKQVESIEEKTGRKIDARLPDEPMVSPWSSKEGGDAHDGGRPDAPNPPQSEK